MMSRSRRHTPITGITVAQSDKPFKRIEHGRARAAERSALAHGDEPPGVKAFGDPWDSRKDGKRWQGYGRADLMRK